MSECQRVRIGIFHFKRISDCGIRFWYISHIPNLALQEQRRHNLNGASDPFVAQQIQVRLQQQTSGDPSRGMQKCDHNCSDHMSRSCFGGVAWSNTPLGKLHTRHAEARSGETHDGIRRRPHMSRSCIGGVAWSLTTACHRICLERRYTFFSASARSRPSSYRPSPPPWAAMGGL